MGKWSSRRWPLPSWWTAPERSPGGTGGRHTAPGTAGRGQKTHLYTNKWLQKSAKQETGKFKKIVFLFTSSVFIAEVGKPPDIAQSDDLPGHRQEELGLAGPLAPGLEAVSQGFFPPGEAGVGELCQRLVGRLRERLVGHHRFWQGHTHTPEAGRKQDKKSRLNEGDEHILQLTQSEEAFWYIKEQEEPEELTLSRLSKRK